MTLTKLVSYTVRDYVLRFMLNRGVNSTTNFMFSWLLALLSLWFHSCSIYATAGSRGPVAMKPPSSGKLSTPKPKL